ncbi:MAG: LON peptidase substrate-binding domain-containing protein [Anaerolineae bacterium]|nr:LON peptidase substrate-binding domain-containing protein [Thermoflexales bacterium]MDW8293219.1 LON peptidase substrate-binding domain-containing protein [Anaerolineae bacterium]
MRELPLFPLNVVLFPGQILPLHIFEPRYRIMISQCLEQSAPFGVVLVAGLSPEAPHDVGTTARIAEVERLPDGRMNILTIGEERFRIHRFRMSEHGYLVGDVSDYPLESGHPEEQLLAQRLRPQLIRYLQYLSDLSQTPLQLDAVPSDPSELAMLTAIALQVSLLRKQLLLSSPNLRAMLEAERALLSHELAMIDVAERGVLPPPGPASFSVN